MRRGIRLSFQAKVLIPVVVIMVLVLVVPTSIVSRRISEQLESGAAESLTTAHAVFTNLQAIRGKNLLPRYQNLPNEPRFKAVAQLADPETMRFLLKELVDESGSDFAIFSDHQGQPLVRVSRLRQFDLKQCAERSSESIGRTLANNPNVDTINVEGGIFEIASVPVLIRENVIGVLTFGAEMGEATAQEFKKLTHGDVVLLVNDQIAAATLTKSDLAESLASPLRAFATTRASANGASNAAPTEKITIGGEHYLYVLGQFGQTRDGQKLGYMLLSSYEKPLQALQASQRTFLWVRLLGILLSVTTVWLFIRQITNPLRQLRDSAEAVGRGDFSRRVEAASRDECGELATVFNQMTANLKASREELEKALATLKSAQAQMIQNEKLHAMGTLAGGIAHDFNNILGAIIGFTELVLDDIPPDGRAARNLGEVLKASNRAKELVRQILTFSRQSQPQRIAVRLGPVIEEPLKLLRATLPSTIEIRSRFETTNDIVLADATQVHQVLMNLGTNACHAMRETGGTLSVTLDAFEVSAEGCSEAPQLKPGPYLRLVVADTGHGMEPAVIARIFEPFFTTKPVGEGTGLGLSVVHGILKDHGGDITVASQPGAGTTFTLFLPLADAELPGAAPAWGPAPRGNERILVVDDEQPLVNMLEQRLSRLGYEVVTHRDSLEALKEFQLAPERFDLVITDQNMPRFTGLDLASKIVECRPDMPIILCSGSIQAPDKTGAIDPLVREYVVKPVNFAELSRTIRRVLSDKQP